MRLRRNKKEEEAAPEALEGPVAADADDPDADHPDAADWALPADAAVTAQAGAAAENPAQEILEPDDAAVSPADEPVTEFDEADWPAEEESFESPAAAEPAWAPSAGGTESGGDGGSPLAGLLSHPTAQQRPELVVAGAFAAAFVVARILKRASE